MRPEVKAILSLEGNDLRNAVLANARVLAYEVKSLDGDDQKRLLRVVEETWPKKGFGASFVRNGSEIRTTDARAVAWLFLGPAVDARPTPAQWAEIATSGVLFTYTSEWLCRHYTEEAAVLAANLCQSDGGREWSELIDSIPVESRLPNAVVEAIVVHLCKPTLPEPDYELWRIGDRFAREGRLEPLQKLSSKDAEIDRRLRPWRAQLGEVEAARSLLTEMTVALVDGRQFDRDDVTWLGGVRAPELLPLLFEALRVANSAERDSPFGVSDSLCRTIHQIGGDEAVRMYDELIESSNDPRIKFLRLRRDEVVQSELHRVGQERVSEIASHLDLPALSESLEI